ncbi:MAG: hypothetical protein HYS56_02565 [Candidatus Omnitrophica bacterium]|nr:hypothetical protein [Candidatus Omnitrophota bacterium]
MRRLISSCALLGILLIIASPVFAEGGIIGKMRGVLKKMNEPDSGKKVEAFPEKGVGEEKEKNDETLIEEDQGEIALEEKKEFIETKGQRTPMGSTVDENGNTVTTSKTDNDVWITEVTDPNGNLISTKKRIDLPGGGEKIEIKNHQTGEISQVMTGTLGQKTGAFEKLADGTKIMRTYENGRKSGSKVTHPNGGVTKTVFDAEGKPQYGKTFDSQGNVLATLGRKDFENGSSMVWETDSRKKTTTSTYTEPDGSVIWETKDDQTGETLNRAGLNADGSRILYQTGKYADDAFRQGGVVAADKTTSGQDWKRNTEEYQNQFEMDEQDEFELDRELFSQMNGGDPVTGRDLIVSSRFTSHNESSESEGHGRELDWEGTSQTQSGYEVRGVDPKGAYEVKPLGNPVAVEGLGKTPSQALMNAMNDASHTVATHIQSEFVDHQQSTQEMRGEEIKDWSFQKSVRDDSQHDSFVVFKDYVVESVSQADTGEYQVKLKARPGVTTKR